MKCKICQKDFEPNKYHPNQACCPSLQCQKERQLQNEKEWRARNPDYFKCLGQESAWRRNRHHYNKLWRQTHKDYLHEYEKSHREQRREYMREYMRRYREMNVLKVAQPG